MYTCLKRKCSEKKDPVGINPSTVLTCNEYVFALLCLVCNVLNDLWKKDIFQINNICIFFSWIQGESMHELF